MFQKEYPWTSTVEVIKKNKSIFIVYLKPKYKCLENNNGENKFLKNIHYSIRNAEHDKLNL